MANVASIGSINFMLSLGIAELGQCRLIDDLVERSMVWCVDRSVATSSSVESMCRCTRRRRCVCCAAAAIFGYVKYCS